MKQARKTLFKTTVIEERDYYNREKRLSLTLLTQKAGGFFNAGVS